MEGRIFSIEEFSVFDGPGIRTTVFLKGCPLKCNWCHSPEGQNYAKQSVKSPNGCIHCNNCYRICSYNREKCDGCGKCVNVCPLNLIRISGEDYTAMQLYSILEMNFKILNMNAGGITLSGGEPLMQGEFLSEIIDLLKGKVHIALQTCGYASSNLFNKIISKVDLVLFDMKIMNKEKALEYEGVDNQVILDNLELLKKSNVPFIIRIPLIPTVVDTEENINEIINRIKGSESLLRVELLPYNKLAGSKYLMIGRKYTPKFDENINSEFHLDLFKANGIIVKTL
jgi:pyruvate formate lyase activating enzyme